MHRVDRLPGGVARLIDAVPDADVGRCLQLLAVSVVDILDLGTPEVAEALSNWRDRGAVPPGILTQLRSAAARHDLDAFVQQRRGDLDGQRAAFRRARGFDCLVCCFADPKPDRDNLREAAYEAAAALGGSAGVVGVLADVVV